MKVLRRPMKLLDRLKKHGKGSFDPTKEFHHEDGNPITSEPFEYIPNQALEEALIEELQNGPNISLAAISASLAQNIDPNIPDRSNSSCNRPLHQAAKYGNAKLMALLLDAGAKIDQANALGQTPLMIACAFTSRRHFACAKLLISRDCNMDLRDKGGSNALEQAITASNVACVKCLLHHGARLACAPDDRRMTSARTSCTLFEQPDESSIVALAEDIRARSIGMELAEANAYFAELEVNGGPSLLDKMMHKRLCSPSHEIVTSIRDHSSLFSSLEVHAPSKERKPLRQQNTKGKTANSILFVEKIRLLAQNFMGRGQIGRASNSGDHNARRHPPPPHHHHHHRAAPHTTQRKTRKSKTLHERKAQPQEVDKGINGARYHMRSHGSRVDGGSENKKYDARRRTTRTSTRSVERRSATDEMSYSRSGRRPRRPNNTSRHRQGRKEDRIRRKRKNQRRPGE